MTTIVAVRKGTSACIAADTLSSYGETKEQAAYVANHDKLIAVGDAWLGPTGPAAAQHVLTSYFAREGVACDFSGADAIFETATELMRVLKEDYFIIPKEDERDSYESIQMEILIAAPAGIFGVYAQRSVQEYTRFYAFGSGAEYALGAMHASYELHDDPEPVALAGLAAAAEFDGSTGLPHTLRRVELAPAT